MYASMDLKAPGKGSQSNLKKYLRLIGNFHPTISLSNHHKEKVNSKKKHYFFRTKNQEQILRQNRTKSLQVNTTNFKNTKPIQKRYQYNPELDPKFIKKMKSNQSSLKSEFKLPKMIQKNKNNQLYLIQTRTNSRLKTDPNQQGSSFYLRKLAGSPNGNMLDFVKMKPTQKHFQRMKNVQIAQKLLLAQPSQQIRRSQHQKFWDEQQSYRRKISLSRMMMKQTKIHNKKSFKNRTKSQWLF